MGNYLTRLELIASVGDTVEKLAGDQTEAANQALVDQAITDCEAEVDAYLADKYETPLSPVPRVLKTQVRKLVLWQLLSARGYQPGGPDESIYKDYQAAVKLLKAISNGDITLGKTASDGSTDPPSRVHAVHPKPALPTDWEDRY